LRISVDAKAPVKIGNYSRGGKNRVLVHAADHDFHSDKTITPFGILIPELGELSLYHILSKVTSDCIVDVLVDWWEINKSRFSHITRLVLNLDNGPENNSRRTQFILRLLDFIRHTGLTLLLAYYPPYHSKYNPIERCWGVLENHWSGELLNSVDAVVSCSGSMTWQGLSPVVTLVTDVYKTGVRLKQSAMKILESQMKRFSGLEKWFVEISPETINQRTNI
jgi:hypothetical protein